MPEHLTGTGAVDRDPHSPSRESTDQFDSYAAALFVVISFTIGYSVFLHVKGWVLPSFFPSSPNSWTAIAVVSFAFVICIVARRRSFPNPVGVDYPKVNIGLPDRMPQFCIEALILGLSVIGLHLLLQTSGGITGPFGPYLSTFPVVISGISRRSITFTLFAILLTFAIYAWNAWFPVPILASLGHDHHMTLASIPTFAISLGFTTLLLVYEQTKARAKQAKP